MDLSEVVDKVSRSTARLEKRMVAIRASDTTLRGVGDNQRATSELSGVPGNRLDDYASPLSTLEYPAQGKLQPPAASSQIDYNDWEPAESLRIAIIVGEKELGSGMLRNQFSALRRQRHDALVYRWQGDVTLDFIGFDAIDCNGDQRSDRVDLVLLSDQVLGPCIGGNTRRELERLALQIRFKLRDSYVVSICADDRSAGLDGHPFISVESKAREQGMIVFDDRLFGEIRQADITRMLIDFARSPRYTRDRCVWITTEIDGVPLPIPKQDV